MDKKIAAEHGIDVERGIKNCMGDEAFYAKILSMFLCDTCFSRAKTVYEQKDYRALFSCLHELKGVSGNAALMSLFNVIVPLVEKLRNGDAEDDAVTLEFTKVQEAYDQACEGIAKILAVN